MQNKFWIATKKQCTDTGMVMTLVALVAGLVTRNQLFQFLSVGALLITIIVPLSLYPFAVIWFGLSGIMGTVSSRVLFGIVFILVVTPVGIIRRFSGKDALNLNKFKKGSSGVFIERNHVFIAADLEHTF